MMDQVVIHHQLITHNNLISVIDFLLKYYDILTLGVEILAVVTGLILFKKFKHTAAKYFIYFLVYIIFMVLIGRYTLYIYDDGPLSFLEGTLIERNYWWFTIFWQIAAVLFFGWYYLNILQNKWHIKVLKASLLLYFIISVLTIILSLPDLFKKPIPIIYIIGGIIILQCVFLYFLEVLQTDKILNFYKSLNFYISCAILIFWLIKTPLVFYEQFYTQLDWSYVHLRAFINLFVITFMYLTYTIGFIIAKPEYD